ncbi:MAG: hypothetical protein KF787_08890 [Phycisphaeraceae bacterium]|nr:hypothetical protein [Phycisphaeraceae bacterium]
MQCRYCMGFRELFELAKGRAWTAEEERAFQQLDQDARNEAVRQLAAETTCVSTEDRVGSDGKTYTAFWLDDNRIHLFIRAVSIHGVSPLPPASQANSLIDGEMH